jgi:hypothetical protein
VVLLAIVSYSQFLDLLLYGDEEDGSGWNGGTRSSKQQPKPSEEAWLKDDVMRISDELVKMLVRIRSTVLYVYCDADRVIRHSSLEVTYYRVGIRRAYSRLL